MIEKSNNYKATFVLDLRNKAESVEEIIDLLKKELEAVNAEVGEVENLGSKDFVRTPDREFRSGIYVNVDFRSPPSGPQALRERLRLNKAVDRVLVQAV